jgi:hypothetical protein
MANLASVAVAACICAGFHAQAQQVPVPKPDMEAGAVALRCELHLARAPDTTQVLYFYLSEARRTVYETDGNSLGNVVQFGRQRIVVSRNGPDGVLRTYAFDRMIGSLTVSWQAAANAASSSPTQTGAGGYGGRENWTLSGECQKVDASRQKF